MQKLESASSSGVATPRTSMELCQSMSIESTSCKTSHKTETGKQSADSVNSSNKLGTTMTIFNVICSAVGLGALLVPTTFCGSGWPLGIVGMFYFGLISDWSSRALVSSTTKVKVKLFTIFCNFVQLILLTVFFIIRKSSFKSFCTHYVQDIKLDCHN